MNQPVSELRAEEGLERYRKYLRIEVSLFIAAMLGAFVLNGYAHLEKYYLILDVPIDRLNISGQKLAAYGAAGLGSMISALLFAIAFVIAVSLIIALTEQPGRPSVSQTSSPRLARFRQRASELNIVFKLFAFSAILAGFSIMAWYLTVHVPSMSGRKSALDTAATCEERTLTFRSLDRYTACQVAESEDMLYLLKRDSKNKTEVSFYTFQIPKAGLVESKGESRKMKFDSDDDDGK
ncbi:hypothetical protein NN484_08940 [Pseudomonas serboccidentalis]|uniref:Uncharacterized protein n=1 Tax=Pseudomonas serboccidentalis TaxID=2964670 RepID=A0ABY7ZFZ0_9PSED|nr:hypothetical protein [Pseudomonas serboccidentalis]WDR37847.1 hypothetical protein NN484_08940 [Pseudomonas serboccidentalis]